MELKDLRNQKVVSISDIRAQRMSREVTDQIIDAEQEVPLPDMADQERVWWRNTQFFANRACRGGGYGRFSYDVGYVGPVRMMRFDCEAYEAFYFLDSDLVIDFQMDPVITRWSHSSAPEFPVVPRPPYTADEVDE